MNVNKLSQTITLRNITDIEATVELEEVGHIYTVGGKKGFTPVTTFVHNWFSKFEENVAIANILKSAKMQDPEYEYYGMDAKDIKNYWNRNRDLGTALHYDIECFYNGKDVQNDSIEYEYFLNFAETYGSLVPYCTEARIFHSRLKLAGSIDMIFIKPNGHLILVDWKRSKQITMETDQRFPKHCKYQGLTHLDDVNFVHYSIQLNTYKYILETEYNYIIDEMYLVILHPNNRRKNFQVHQVSHMNQELSIMRDYWINNGCKSFSH